MCNTGKTGGTDEKLAVQLPEMAVIAIPFPAILRENHAFGTSVPASRSSLASCPWRETSQKRQIRTDNLENNSPLIGFYRLLSHKMKKIFRRSMMGALHGFQSTPRPLLPSPLPVWKHPVRKHLTKAVHAFQPTCHTSQVTFSQIRGPITRLDPR